MELLQTLIYFLAALVILVAIHEFGHFYVARRCGVKVLRFSIGFGKRLCSWHDRSGTEYSLALIPLGGYVKMLDEREGEVPEALLPYAFTRKSVWQRIAIVAAGPLANFILAVLLFWLLLLPGGVGIAPVIDQVQEGSVAEAAGLEAGQEIVAVDGELTPTWQQLNRQLLARLGESGTIRFSAKYPDSDLVYESEASLQAWLRGVEEPKPVEGLGLTLYRPSASLEIAQVVAASPAERAGIEVGDLLTLADAAPIADWSAWVDYVRARPQQSISLQLERDGQMLAVSLLPESVGGSDGKAFGRVGLAPQVPEWPEHMLREYSYSLTGAFVKAVAQTWDTAGFVLSSVKKLLIGQISTKNLSGPITIAKVAGDSAKAGWAYFAGFLALLSVSLGVFNLLPIPVLDGGHLFYYLIEVVKGSPLSERVQVVGYQVGVFVVAGIMMLAIYNDLMRL